MIPGVIHQDRYAAQVAFNTLDELLCRFGGDIVDVIGRTRGGARFLQLILTAACNGYFCPGRDHR